MASTTTSPSQTSSIPSPPNSPRIVPWTGLDEWRFVRDALFNKDLNKPGVASEDSIKDLKLALMIGDVWRLRGKLPVAVDATLNLTRLLYIKDDDNVTLGNKRQLALSASLLRMVNELVDPGQRGQYALPINRLAEQIGLPRLLVDIRHESTHDALPTMEILEVGARLALDWLLTNYWEPYALATLPSALKDRVESALSQISVLLTPSMTTIPEVTMKTVIKILSTEIDYLENRERLAVLMAVLATPKWLYMPSFQVVEAALSRMGLLGVSVVELLLHLITNDYLQASLGNGIMEIMTRLIPFAIVNQETCDRILHALVQHPTPFAFTLSQMYFGNPTMSAQFTQHCLLFANLLNAVQTNARSTMVTASIDLEQTLQLIERKISEPALRGYVTDWRPIPIGCAPGYNPLKDGFWKLYQQQ